MDFQDEELSEILNIFRVESEEIIKRLNSSLLSLEKNPSDMDLIVLLFRDAHSLKGAARMIGFNNTQNLAHKMEDIFGLAKEHKIDLTPDIADVMYNTVDIINNIIIQTCLHSFCLPSPTASQGSDTRLIPSKCCHLLSEWTGAAWIGGVLGKG